MWMCFQGPPRCRHWWWRTAELDMLDELPGWSRVEHRFAGAVLSFELVWTMGIFDATSGVFFFKSRHWACWPSVEKPYESSGRILGWACSNSGHGCWESGRVRRCYPWRLSLRSTKNEKLWELCRAPPK
jgi:hypothetical protein